MPRAGPGRKAVICALEERDVRASVRVDSESRMLSCHSQITTRKHLVHTQPPYPSPTRTRTRLYSTRTNSPPSSWIFPRRRSTRMARLNQPSRRCALRGLPCPRISYRQPVASYEGETIYLSRRLRGTSQPPSLETRIQGNLTKAPALEISNSENTGTVPSPYLFPVKPRGVRHLGNTQKLNGQTPRTRMCDAR
jgi:hypothetical protein